MLVLIVSSPNDAVAVAAIILIPGSHLVSSLSLSGVPTVSWLLRYPTNNYLTAVKFGQVTALAIRAIIRMSLQLLLIVLLQLCDCDC